MNDFKILQKVYDMILYGNQCLNQFPKSEKYALAAEIKQSMYRLLRLTIETNKKYHKRCKVALLFLTTLIQSY